MSINNTVNNEEHPEYIQFPDHILLKPGPIIIQPRIDEVFAVMFLNNRHQLIKYEEMFRGTIDGASVYPREVAKRALQLNAAALIVAHNHPSGVPEPSKSDERITHRLKDALGMLQIRLLDHVIVGGVDTVSMADRGII